MQFRTTSRTIELPQEGVDELVVRLAARPDGAGPLRSILGAGEEPVTFARAQKAVVLDTLYEWMILGGAALGPLGPALNELWQSL